MLLKSCAMPPVNWPTASIFCAWCSRSSLTRSAATACDIWAGDGSARACGSSHHIATAVTIDTAAVAVLTSASIP